MTLTFGAFLPPFHSQQDSPALSIRSDLDLIEWLDRLGLEEVWVGEHHSAGLSPVYSPELLLAAAAERTHRIKLATGIVCLPFHHPLTVAERLVQLDQQSQGRAVLGVGAGTSPLDSRMFGFDKADGGRRFEQALEPLIQLCRGQERVSATADWFTVTDALLPVRPFRGQLEMAVAALGSDVGARVAGRHGLGLLSGMGRLGRTGPSQSALWDALTEEAALTGAQADRSRWRIAVPVHVAPTRQEAFDQLRAGFGRWIEYNRRVPKIVVDLPAGREVEAAAERGDMFFGTVEDVVEQIEKLWASTGGFGTLLVHSQGFANRQHTRDSFELLARSVIPQVTGALAGLQAASNWVAAHSGVPAQPAPRPAATDDPRQEQS